MQLYLKAPPLQEPIALEEVKTYLRISSEQEDGLLKTLISSARSYVEGATGRALLKQGWVLHLIPPYPPSFPLVKNEKGELSITLPKPPLINVTSVKTKGQDVPYIVEEMKVKLSPILWGHPLSIAFWAGYGEDALSVPADLRMAILMGVRFLYEGQKIELPLLTPYKVRRLM